MKKLVLLTVLFLTISSICFAPKNPYRIIHLHAAYEQYIENEQLEKRVELILKTIRVIESGGRYTIGGASGETGAYQFMPATWRSYSLLFFNEVLDIRNPFNQDRVARAKVKYLVDKGNSNAEIASIWNCGSKRWKGKIGINWRGVPYNVPRHVNRFLRIYSKLETPNYIPINMRSYKAELVDYNNLLDLKDNCRRWYEQPLIVSKSWPKYQVIHMTLKEEDYIIQKLQRVGVSASQAGEDLRKVLLSLSNPEPRYKRFLKTIKSKLYGITRNEST